MITISDAMSDDARVSFYAHGDDVDTVLRINLARGPFRLAFDDPLPAIRVEQGPTLAEATLVRDAAGDPILTVTFVAPPPSVFFSAPVVTATFLYPSV